MGSIKGHGIEFESGFQTVLFLSLSLFLSFFLFFLSLFLVLSLPFFLFSLFLFFFFPFFSSFFLSSSPFSFCDRRHFVTDANPFPGRGGRGSIYAHGDSRLY